MLLSLAIEQSLHLQRWQVYSECTGRSCALALSLLLQFVPDRSILICDFLAKSRRQHRPCPRADTP